jgi:hypothetical protein
MSIPPRWPLFAVSLLILAGCAESPPPAPGPEADGGSPPNARARSVIDAQLNAHPDSTAPGLSGAEASTIYQSYLRRIGRPTSIGQQSSTGSSGGLTPIGSTGGTP